MSIIESYANNQLMRETYFRLNGYTHAEIHDATESEDCINENAYKVFICDANRIGTYAPREFAIYGQAQAWCAKFAPELIVE